MRRVSSRICVVAAIVLVAAFGPLLRLGLDTQRPVRNMRLTKLAQLPQFDE